MLSPKLIHHYQHAGIEFLTSNTHCALFAQMGTGKTLMTLSALSELIMLGDVERVLIIAPRRVAATVWHSEAANWQHTKHLRVLPAVGTANERRSSVMRCMAFDHGIVTINPENLEWLMGLLEDLYAKGTIKKLWPFDTVVFDEFSLFKSHDSNRFKLMESICCDKTVTEKGVARLVESPVQRVYGLTATPASNGVGNLWAQVKLLDSGDRLGTRVSHFRENFMQNKAPPRAEFYDWQAAASAEDVIYDKISDIVKVFLADDYLDMPDLIHNDVVVDIPKKVRDQLKVLETELLLEVKNNLGLDEEIIATNGAALVNKCLQFSNGAVVSGETSDADYSSDKWAEVHRSKLDALAELDSVVDEPMVVAYWFKSDLARIKKKFPKWEVLDKKGSQIAAWNKGKVQRLLLHPASAGHGINLQYGGKVITLFSMFWSLEIYEQLIGRLYRQGQKGTVTVNRIVVRNTVEQRVADALANKAQLQDTMLEYLNEQGR